MMCQPRASTAILKGGNSVSLQNLWSQLLFSPPSAALHKIADYALLAGIQRIRKAQAHSATGMPAAWLLAGSKAPWPRWCQCARGDGDCLLTLHWT
mmetsp:Transcript_129490/g.224977  ORF Transcript_129490/g.224977 Transcript_129490/m.224977 type:complete len:96 (-) Transcript_129490:396-683(-)